MKQFQPKCVECMLLSSVVAEKCDEKRMLHPKSQQAFDNIKANNGLHSICRTNQFREYPFSG